MLDEWFRKYRLSAQDTELYAFAFNVGKGQVIRGEWQRLGGEG